jgi:DNA processing protein
MEEIRKIAINDKEYPEALRIIKNPPLVLFIKGIIDLADYFFAVVGTRNPSAYGKQTAMEITARLVDAGLTIVSGLAPGIDTLAHVSAVERNRKTIAVLGTGIDKKSIYPKENIGLAERIVETGGCLVSEYPPGTSGSRFTFPQRNRIISGLSRGVLAVEAKEKSGTLITANYALSQKRKIFAVPGSIYSDNSKGTNMLIKKGAKLVQNANDILEGLNLSGIKHRRQERSAS